MTITMTSGSARPAARASRLGRLRTALRITALELRLLLREPTVVVGLVAFPAVTVLILAGVFGSAPTPSSAGSAQRALRRRVHGRGPGPDGSRDPAGPHRQPP